MQHAPYAVIERAGDGGGGWRAGDLTQPTEPATPFILGRGGYTRQRRVFGLIFILEHTPHPSAARSRPCVTASSRSRTPPPRLLGPWEPAAPRPRATRSQGGKVGHRDGARSLDTSRVPTRSVGSTTVAARPTSHTAHRFPQPARTMHNRRGRSSAGHAPRVHTRGSRCAGRSPTDPYAQTNDESTPPQKTTRSYSTTRRAHPDAIYQHQPGSRPHSAASALSPLAPVASVYDYQFDALDSFPNTVTSTLHDTRRRVLPPAHISAPALDTATTAASRSRPRRAHIKWGDSRRASSPPPVRCAYNAASAAPQPRQSTPGQAHPLLSRIPVPILARYTTPPSPAKSTPTNLSTRARGNELEEAGRDHEPSPKPRQVASLAPPTPANAGRSSSVRADTIRQGILYSCSHSLSITDEPTGAGLDRRPARRLLMHSRQAGEKRAHGKQGKGKDAHIQRIGFAERRGVRRGGGERASTASRSSGFTGPR
ncbi:hypothetical protein C8R45DRAFT_1159453 [Mycena sanguinolenta]|nr:hypothetical protein C8R45DRAFT_1159453 [Mycena sanguinolenta]